MNKTSHIDPEQTAVNLDNAQNETQHDDVPSTSVAVMRCVKRYKEVLRVYYGEYLRLAEVIRLTNVIQRYSDERYPMDFDALAVAPEMEFAMDMTGMLGSRGSNYLPKYRLPDEHEPVADASATQAEVH